MHDLPPDSGHADTPGAQPEARPGAQPGAEPETNPGSLRIPEGASLLLIGLRGSGKSTLAGALADRIGRASLDLDDCTREYLGAGSITDLFNRFGEARFRAAEYRALVNQAITGARRGPVVALGGGTPTAPGAAEFLRDAASRGMCVIVYLRGSPGTLRERLARDAGDDRPSLTGADPLDEIDAVFASRDPLYCQLAAHIIEIDGQTPGQTLDAICAALGA